MADGYCTGQHRQALSLTVRREEGKAELSPRYSCAADSPSGVSLKHGRDLCRSSHLFYEYSGKIPQFKFQLSHLFARSWVCFLICDIHPTHWLLGTTNWNKTDPKAHCNLKTHCTNIWYLWNTGIKSKNQPAHGSNHSAMDAQEKRRVLSHG